MKLPSMYEKQSWYSGQLKFWHWEQEEGRATGDHFTKGNETHAPHQVYRADLSAV